MKSLTVLNECSFSAEQRTAIEKQFSDVTFYTDTVSAKQAITRIGTRSIVIMDQFVLEITEQVLQACQQLELIIVNTTAFDRIDVDLLKRYHIKLAHVPEYATQDVAEVAIGMMLELNNHSQLAQDAVTGAIDDLPGYDYQQSVRDIWPHHPLEPFIMRNQLKGQTVGIFGYGKIGKRCAELCQALGMKVIAYNRKPLRSAKVDFVSADQLFNRADIILITMAYHHGSNDAIVGKKLLALAKKDSLLLSVSPSELIDFDALLGLQSKFRGIGFDYFISDKVLALKAARMHNMIITPHLGSQSQQAAHNMTEALIAAATHFAGGNDYNVVA